MSKTFTQHAKKVTFSDAKVGDKVWSLTEGWCVVKARLAPHNPYPLTVEFENGGRRNYTLWGLLHFNDLNPTLFWNEVGFDTPEKPMPDLPVDAKVWVWNQEGMKYKRHFSHFDGDGSLFAFNHGHTSFTGEGSPEIGVTSWNHWELAE